MYRQFRVYIRFFSPGLYWSNCVLCCMYTVMSRPFLGVFITNQNGFRSVLTMLTFQIAHYFYHNDRIIAINNQEADAHRLPYNKSSCKNCWKDAQEFIFIYIEVNKLRVSGSWMSNWPVRWFSFQFGYIASCYLHYPAVI